MGKRAFEEVVPFETFIAPEMPSRGSWRIASKQIELLLLLDVMRTSSIEHVDEDEGDFSLSILLVAMDSLLSIGRAILNKQTANAESGKVVASRNSDFL